MGRGSANNYSVGESGRRRQRGLSGGDEVWLPMATDIPVSASQTFFAVRVLTKHDAMASWNMLAHETRAHTRIGRAGHARGVTRTARPRALRPRSRFRPCCACRFFCGSGDALPRFFCGLFYVDCPSPDLGGCEKYIWRSEHLYYCLWYLFFVPAPTDS